MGDFSRDPTARLQDSVAKHYVGVRLQQGVPILDTDWNELEDLRRHEVASVLQRFFGDGVPAGNDGFRVEALVGGGVGTIVLQALTVPLTGTSTIAIDFPQSTAASLLGFLPDMATSERPGGNPARLTGNETGPFPLSDGLTLAVQVNGEPAEVVTFAAADFTDITQASAAEVVAVLNTGLSLASASVGIGNDFIIRGGDGTLAGAGRLMVEGVEAINEGNLVFSSQPLYENPELAAAWGVPIIPALTTPPPAGRTDLVYLDVWDREVGAGEDDAIVHAAVGIEATVRLRREWAVRVAEGMEALEDVPHLPGHRYGALAVLERTSAVAEVEAGAVRDLRVRSLNVAKYLKTPVLYERAGETVDVERFASLLELFSEILRFRLQQRVFDFSYTDDYDSLLVLGAVRDLAQQAAFAAIQTRAGTFNNADALRFLDTLEELQATFVATATSFGNVGGTAQDFIDGYLQRLDGGPATLRPRLDAGDFLGAVQAQEAINAWLSAPVDVLPEGDIVVVLESVQPANASLAVGNPINITYRIESLLASPRAQETINVAIDTAAPSTWSMGLDRGQIVVDAMGGQDTAVVTVTPQAGTVSVVFRLTATAARNPEVSQVHVSDAFEIDQLPPVDVFLQWSAPPLDSEGRFPIPLASLPSVLFQVQLINTSDADAHTFALSHFVTPPAGQEGQWLPEETSPVTSTVVVPAGDTVTRTPTIVGPGSPPVGSQGTLTVTATLTEEDGTPVVDGKSRTLEIPFIVTA